MYHGTVCVTSNKRDATLGPITYTFMESLVLIWYILSTITTIHVTQIYTNGIPNVSNILERDTPNHLYYFVQRLIATENKLSRLYLYRYCEIMRP